MTESKLPISTDAVSSKRPDWDAVWAAVDNNIAAWEKHVKNGAVKASPYCYQIEFYRPLKKKQP